MQAKRNAEQQAQLTSFEAPAAGGQQGAVANAALQTGAAPERRLTASTIALPQNYQLPDTAALNAAMQSAGYQHAAGQMPPNAEQRNAAAPIRATTRGTGAMNQPMGSRATLHGNSNAAAAISRPVAAGDVPGRAGSGTVASGIESNGWSNSATGLPATVIQQPMMQPPPIRQPQPTLQSWPQVPNQLGPTATVNSPATVQYR